MSGGAFDALIAPVSRAAFFATTFEREPLHVARNDPAAFAWLYDLTCVEDALVLGAAAPEHFTLIKHGAPALTAQALTGERTAPREHPSHKPARFFALDPRRVLAAVADGYTLTISDASTFHPALARFCNRIQADLGFFVQANAYLTPAGAQGFETHYDTHDTLIVQLEGAKTWAIYAPVLPLPLELQPFSAARHAGRLGPPRTIGLAPGDSLYLPRGFPHHAAATEQRSLHLTFALSPTRVVDLLDALVRLAALGDVELRRALPPGWQRDPTFATSFSARLAELVPRALVPERIGPAAELVANDLLAATRTVAAGTFAALDATASPAPATRLSLRDDAPFEVRDRGERLDVVLATSVIALPGETRAALARLAIGPATFAEIAATLPAANATEFVRTLVLAGILSVDAPA